MRRLIAVILMSWVGAACTTPTDVTNGSCSVECETSSTCEVGETCVEGCCAPFTGCTPSSCATGEFCDDDLSCKTIAQKCLAAECECHIANSAGEFEVNDGAMGTPPTIRLSAGASMPVTAVLATKGGAPLPGATFSFALTGASPGSFSTSEQSLTATSTAGTATLTATAGDYASCSATVINLGAAPVDGNLRFLAFDSLTGAPIAGAQIIVDRFVSGVGDGTDDGSAAVTGSDGLTQTTALTSATGKYSVTVFKEGYNYLSVVGLDFADASDIALPLMSRSVDPDTGGFRGKIDFNAYEEFFTGGQSKTLQAGMVVSSFPLRALLNFNTDLFLGPQTTANCNETPSAAGCYPIRIPEFRVDTNAAIPGGAVVGLGRTPVKSHFDVVGQPGRRYAWDIGGELSISDVSGVVGTVMPYIRGECTCDTTNACDADGGSDCNCDFDCGIDVGSILGQVMPLLPNMAVGVKGNLPLSAAPLSEWQSYLANTPYSSVSSDARFPILDDGTGNYGKLPLREALRNYTELRTAGLPDDPDHPGTSMDAMVAISGADAAGFGFVPLGIGVGLDCTVGNCFNRDANASGFDGQINSVDTCIEEHCTPGVPMKSTANTLPVFRAAAHGGLEGQSAVTMVVSLPLASLIQGEAMRATAVVLRGELPAGGSDLLADKTFAKFASLPASIAGRSYNATLSDSGIDAHWVTLATATPEGVTTPSTRWNIYFAPGAPTFKAPMMPSEGWPDPFEPAPSDADVPEGKVNATHVALKLAAGETLVKYVSNNGSNLNHLADVAEGLSIRNANITAQE